MRPFLHEFGHVGTALSLDEGRQHTVFFAVLLIRLVITSLLCRSIGREHHPPARIKYLPAGCLELHAIRLTHNGRSRKTAVGIEHGDEAAGNEVEHPSFYIGEVDRRLAGRDNGMVVRDFRIVEHFLRLRQGGSLQRRGPGLIAPQPLQNGGTLRIDVIAQEGRIYTRISSDLFLVERLDSLQRVVGRVGKLLVALHLQGGQVEKAERCFTALLLRHRGNGKRHILDTCQQLLASRAVGYGVYTTVLFLLLGLLAGSQGFLLLLGFQGLEHPAVALADEGRESSITVDGIEHPVLLGHKVLNLQLTVHDKSQRRRLHPPDGKYLAVLPVLHGVQARGIHAQQPIADGTAQARFVQLLDAVEVCREVFADGLLGQ